MASLNSSYRYLLKGSALTFFVSVARMGLGFALNLALARLMPVKEFGKFSFLMSAVTFLCIPVKMGLDSSAVRFISEFRTRPSGALEIGFVRVGVIFIACATMVLAILAEPISWMPSFPGHRWTKLVLSHVLLLSLLSFVSACLLGKKCLFAGTFIEGVVRHLAFLSSLLICYQFSRTSFDLELVGLLSATSLAVALLGATLVAKFATKSAEKPIASYRVKEWLRTSAALFLVSSFHLVLKQSDLLMLGVLGRIEDVGIYGVASRLSDLCAFGLGVTAVVANPKLAEAFYSGNRLELIRTARFVSKLGFLSGSLFAILLALLAKPILSLYGEQFLKGKVVLIIFLVGQALLSVTSVVGYLLNMTGNENENAKALFLAALVNIALNPILILFLGMEGAAIATLMSQILWQVLALRAVKVRLAFNPIWIAGDYGGKTCDETSKKTT